MPELKSDSRWIKGQSIAGVTTIGDPLLKRKAQSVTSVVEVADLCEAMVNRLRELNGAGLAAPQIGFSLRIIIVEVRKTDLFPDRPESPLYVMINPTLGEIASEKLEDWEGCFSVPGLVGVVPRAKSVRVRYTSLDGASHDEVFTGYIARVIQHEYDHLEGKEFLSRMTSMETISTVENWRKFIIPTKQ